MSDVVLEVKDLAKRFTLVELERLLELKPSAVVKRVEAVRKVSLTVPTGQVYGFLGPNGAGKTTTMKMCMDLIQPTSGTIQIFGSTPSDPSIKQRIGYLPEHPYFYDYLRPQEILDYFGRLFGIGATERMRRIDELLSRVGLQHARNRSLRKFSKGMLQRLGVASALINDPDLIVLDEPLSGLDPMGRKAIRDIIIEERAKGKTIFFSSHILSDIEHLCDRVAIVVNGVVKREGELSSLLQSDTRTSEMLLRNVSEEALTLINAHSTSATDMGSSTWKAVVPQSEMSKLLIQLLQCGAIVDELQPHQDSLEELFVRVSAEGSAVC
ncbi:MAG: ABC transporter ATP-binding protein [Myxococcota bacterium]|nr:ABC transporter ATP-binding protein [Myxococcota bacterium]